MHPIMRPITVLCLCALPLQAQPRQTLGVWQSYDTVYDFQWGGRLEIVRDKPLQQASDDPAYRLLLNGTWNAEADRLRITLEDFDFEYGDLRASDMGLDAFVGHLGDRLAPQLAKTGTTREQFARRLKRQLQHTDSLYRKFLSVVLEGTYRVEKNGFGFEVSAARGGGTLSMSVSTDNGTVTLIRAKSWGQVKKALGQPDG